MATPILATKLYIPPPQSKAVLRPRLIERLNEGLHTGHKLSLISAPAGFGKTTLVSEWAAHCRRTQPKNQIAWLSLDEEDRDPARFLTYLLATLQTLARTIGQGITGELQSSPLPQIELILTTLINEITTFPDPFTLILDDYHVVDSNPVDQAFTFLIEHLPPQMHLIITTREDPQLPLARYRARGQMVELRATDLRFTHSEAAEFLNQVMNLNLSGEDIAALDSRTEGWIAGLQLAALSLQGQQDIPGFIRAFAGNHRYIIDYLVEEVLRCQPEVVRSFLLQTAILDRLSGSLCDAVTGQQDGQSRLETLERGNFFLIPLDDQRHWYRFHALFAEVLQTHLKAEQPEQVATLHRRASEWCEQHGSTADAIHHALAAEDFERAAEMIERSVPAMRQSRQEVILLGWLQALPDEVFRHRLVLSVHYAGILLENGHLDGVESRLREAEQWLGTPVDMREQPIFEDPEDLDRLPGFIAMYRAAMALAQGNLANTMHHARRLLELARENDDFLRGAASSMLGLASWTSGDLETAYQVYAKGMSHLQKTGFIPDVIGGSVTLADIRLTQGRLRDAMSIYERGLQLATRPGGPSLRGAADMHVGMSEIYRERNDLHTAMQHLLKSKELGEFNGLPKNPYRWRVAMARIYEVHGDLDKALDLLDEAEPLYNGDFSPNVRPVQALKARIWVAQGRLGESLGWARQQGLSAEDDLSYLREFEHITLARILLVLAKDSHAEGPLRDAIRLLARLLKAAEEGGRMGSAIEILVLQTLAHQMQEDISAALVPLERALTLAEPEGYLRIFLDEGTDMAKILRVFSRGDIVPNYTGIILGAFTVQQQKSKGDAPLLGSLSLIEPLSQRELEILHLLQTELSVPEIAGELVIAASTIRSHTKSIYSKLGVNNRRAAVKRAAELKLV